MSCSKEPETTFWVEVIPPYQFHLISSMAPFTKGEKREAMAYPYFLSQGEQMNLIVRDRKSFSIAGCAVLRVHPTETVIVDFYILERYRRQGAGRKLIKKIESLARQKGINRINTGKSLHSDNEIMIGFCQKMGFVKLPLEICYFSQLLGAQGKRMHRFCSRDFSRFVPENNRIVPLTNDYFEPVYEMAGKLLIDDPSYSEEVIYRTLLLCSEKYSHVLVRGKQVNGFAVCCATGKHIHLNFIAIRDRFRRLGLSTLLVGSGLCRAYKDGKATFSYIAYKTNRLFNDISQIFQNPNFTIIQMEKTLL